MTAMASPEPTRLLIAAMGGEGGGVLAGWLTEAALASNLWVQRTSVPGVAQRTGATTYYLEFLPKTGTRRPVMALHPAPGRVDVLVATELLEATRMVGFGFVTPDRTALIASTHRTFTVDEKSSMTDGRLDPSPLIATCRRFARRAVTADLAEVARNEGCHLNSVVMGMIAASGTLPIPLDACRAAMAGGKAASRANERGFDAGVRLIRDMNSVPDLRGAAKANAAPPPPVTPRRPLPPSTETAFLPDEAAGIAAEGMRRLTEYQDAAYAATYLAHLRRLAAHPAATPGMLASVARQMALRMSYEDTHRVAQLKLKSARLSQVRAEAKARPGDIVDVAEYMKPGPEEIFGMLPRRIGARLLAMSEKRGWTRFSFPMKVRTTRISGFARLRLLAWARRWRPASLRHHEEMAWLAAWLSRIETALDRAPDAAGAIAETAALVRGYGSTYKRGMRNWRLIDSRVIAPCLNGRRDPALLADAVLQARLAATKDPDGQTLDRMIAAFETAASEPRAAAE